MRISSAARYTVTACVVGVAPLVVALPAHAGSVACNYASSEVNNSDFHGTMSGAQATYNFYTGPSTDCTRTGGTISAGDGFYGWCYYRNVYGNSWVYGRKEGTQTKGWISSTHFNLTYTGSWGTCNQGSPY